MSNQVYMSEIPNCGYCTKQASYDASTLNGQWAWMCNDCWPIYRKSKTLGTGHGQKLILKTELKR